MEDEARAGDGLVESASGPASSGHERRVYRLTDHGERMLRAWMGVIKEERDLSTPSCAGTAPPERRTRLLNAARGFLRVRQGNP